MQKTYFNILLLSTFTIFSIVPLCAMEKEKESNTVEKQTSLMRQELIQDLTVFISLRKTVIAAKVGDVPLITNYLQAKEKVDAQDLPHKLQEYEKAQNSILEQRLAIIGEIVASYWPALQQAQAKWGPIQQQIISRKINAQEVDREVYKLLKAGFKGIDSFSDKTQSHRKQQELLHQNFKCDTGIDPETLGENTELTPAAYINNLSDQEVQEAYNKLHEKS